MEANEKVDPEKIYSIEEAIDLALSTATTSFEETLEAAYNLGVNPSQNMVRGTCVLPHGTGKEVKILAFARGEKQKEAQEADADWVGGEELAEKIEDGWLEFDQVVATPDMMSVVGRLGRILGPRGMMPSPKSNTVTEEIKEAVTKLKKGQVEFRTDKFGVVHVPFGKDSFSSEDLRENLVELTKAIYEQRPEEGIDVRYIQRVSISATMGPGIRVSVDELREASYEIGV